VSRTLRPLTKTFHTDFTNSQIGYQVDLLFQMILGYADLDAYFFVELAGKRVEEKGRFFGMTVSVEANCKKLSIYLQHCSSPLNTFWIL